MPIVRQPVPDMEKETIMTDAYERAKREHDTREKLEADVRRAAEDMERFSYGERFINTNLILRWLDRQAAITERHWMEINGANTLANIELNKQREELQAKVDELQAQLAQCKESYADAKGSRDRLQAQLDSAKYDCLTCDAKAELQRKVDELEAELDAYDQTHMALPLDADGVPIHVGDFLECRANGYEGKFEVFAVGAGVVIGNHDIGFVTDNPTDWFHVAKYCRHVKPRTVEDVLATFRFDAKNIYDDPTLNGNERVDELEALDERVADELRELGVCDE